MPLGTGVTYVPGTGAWTPMDVTYASGAVGWYTTTSITTTSVTYAWPNQWNDAPGPPGVFTSVLGAPPRELTPAQRREAERVRDEARAAGETRNRERAEAGARATELLRAILSTEQLRTMDEHGWFDVTSNRGNTWRIQTGQGQSGNVHAYQDGRQLGRFCAHPPDGLPDGDAFVAQMLSLENDEDEFLRIANRHAGRAHERVAA